MFGEFPMDQLIRSIKLCAQFLWYQCLLESLTRQYPQFYLMNASNSFYQAEIEAMFGFTYLFLLRFDPSRSC